MINLNSRERLNLVLKNPSLEILADRTLLNELYEVISRPKFKKYISEEQVRSFMEMINERIKFVVTTIAVKASPDPKDDFCWRFAKNLKVSSC